MDHHIAHSLYTQLYDNANVTVQGTILESEVALNNKIDDIVTMCKEHFRNSSVPPEVDIVRYIQQYIESDDEYSQLYDTDTQQYIILKCLEIVSNID